VSAALLPFRPRRGRGTRGGMFVGVVGGYGLVIGPMHEQLIDWHDATVWARDLRIWGASDFQLPTLADLVELAAMFPEIFCRSREAGGEIYWSCESESKLDAHVAHFGPANFLSHWGKHHRCKAVAVRHLAQEAA
jgi:hypothetical protein